MHRYYVGCVGFIVFCDQYLNIADHSHRQGYHKMIKLLLADCYNIIVTLLFALGSFGLGRLLVGTILLSNAMDNSRAFFKSVCFLVGIAMWGVVFSFVFMIKLNCQVVLMALLPFACLTIYRMRDFFLTSPLPHHEKKHWPLVLVLSVYALGALIISLAPPTAGDVLNYHFDIAQSWVWARRIYFIEDHPYAGLPTLMHSWYAAALALRAEYAGVLLILLMQIAFCIILATVAKKQFGANAAVFSVLIYIFSPLFVLVSTSAFVDAPAAIFVSSAFLLLLAEKKISKSMLFLATLMLGAAAGVKSNALIIFPVWLFWLLLLGVSQFGWRRALLCCICAGIGLALVSGGFYIRTWIWAGNPFYPTVPRWTEKFFPNVIFKSAVVKYNARPLWENLLAWWMIVMCPWRLYGKTFTPSIMLMFSPLALAFIPVGILLKSVARGLFVKIFVVLMATYVLIAAVGGGEARFYFLPEGLAALGAAGAAIVLSARLKRGRWLTGLGIASMAVLTFGYLFICCLKTIKYHTGQEFRGQYLAKNTSYYQAYEYINANLCPDAVVGICSGNAYYLKRKKVRISWWTSFPYKEFTSLDDWRMRFREKHCSHVLINSFESENKNKVQYPLVKYLKENASFVRRFYTRRQGRWHNVLGGDEEYLDLYLLNDEQQH